MNIIKRIEEYTIPTMPKRKDFRIGVIGAGFIVSNCQLVAYSKAGFNPNAICDINIDLAKKVADDFKIKKVYFDWHDLVDDEDIEVLDIALPPHIQKQVVEYAVKKKHIRGVLCQKPLAMSVEDARDIVKWGEDFGKPIAVNSNMRYDQSIRALKYCLNENILGKPVLASIDMRATPDWQNFLKDYNKLELYAMGIHHIDAFRYLFGDPEKVTAVCRTDPRTAFEHIDGITQYTFQYENGFMATSLDDVWAWPEEPCAQNNYIKWRVEGMEGIAEGDIGWHKREPEFAGSTIQIAAKSFPGEWLTPEWKTKWFPDAFIGTMSNLLCAIEEKKEPEINAKDNINTLRLVEACYLSIKEERTVLLEEIN